MTNHENSLPALAKKYRISYRQAWIWVRNGYLLVSKRNAGKGKSYVLAPDEELKLEIMARLVRVGISPQLAHKRAISTSDYIGPGVRIVIEREEDCTTT